MDVEATDSSRKAIQDASSSSRKRPRVVSPEQASPPPTNPSTTGAIPKNTPAVAQPKAKTQKLPPVVLKGIPESHRDLVADLKRVMRHPFQIRYSYDSTTITTTDKTDHTRFTETLQSQDREFHTFPLKDEKSVAFVLRGLDGDPDIQQLGDELNDEYELDVKNIYQMKTKGRRPLYMVILKGTTTLRQLTERVPHVLHTKITWEKRNNNRLITQCRRCQKWGHSQGNCHNAPKSVKCAGSHYTYQCTKTRDTPAKCANCGQDHPACSVDCPVYKQRVSQLRPSAPPPM